MTLDWPSLAAWIPIAAVSAMAMVACLGAVMLPERPARRRTGLLAAMLCGAVAVGGTVWQQRREAGSAAAQRDAASDAAESREEGEAKLLRRLHATSELFAAAVKELPGAGVVHSFDTVDAGFAALAAQSETLERRVKLLLAESAGRSIDDATAASLAAYLRQRGSHRVVVSCIPKDEEAYLYANRIATILRQAGWDAVGPEPTSIFGGASAMAIGLYARAGEPPDAARLLTEAFTRFNIPYQSRIASNDMIPDAETLELYVAKKP